MQNRKIETRNAGQGQREVRSYAVQFKASGEDGSIEGYGSVFGVKDSYDDVIAAGAFAATLAQHKANASMPAMLWQHNGAEPIGVWTDMHEDTRGLFVRGRLCMDTARGKEAHALMKMGAMNGLSIGFVSKAWSYDNETSIRTLTGVDLWEVSPVTFPANTKARVTGVKAADVAAIQTIRQAEQELRDAGLTAEAAKAFIAAVKRIALDERDAHEAAAAMQKAQRLLNSLTN